MTGTQFAGQAHAICADLPIMLISGFGGPDLQGRAHQAGIARLLSKPLARSELAQALAGLLEGKEPVGPA